MIPVPPDWAIHLAGWVVLIEVALLALTVLLTGVPLLIRLTFGFINWVTP